MLQYDNQAWNFFALAWISLYLLPSWYFIVKKLYKAFIGTKDSDIGAVARTSDEEKKAALLKKNAKGFKTLTTGFFINLIFTILFTALFIYLSTSIQSGGEVNTFDPFTILDVPSGSDLKIIKKAYKKMSLKWHPDKNPNNPAAEAKFMMVAKAYEALTDPTAKENFEKFGNPDGKQSLEVSIGLPSWLLDSDNRNLVLMAYLIIMVGVIPFCVWKYYSNSSKFGEKDVMYDTYSWYHHSLDDTTLMKSLPETIAGSAEFRERNMPKNASGEKEQLQGLLSKVKSSMQKPQYNHPILIKGNVLMHAHLTRQTEGLSEAYKEDLHFMLSKANSLIDAMISVCQHQEALKTALNCIQFGQFVTQACWNKDISLMQLPHFTEKELKHVAKGKSGVTSIKDYMELAKEDKKGLKDMTPEQQNDVHKCCDIIPKIEVETKIFVDDDEDDKVYEGDLCTVQVKVDRCNLSEGETAGLVHAPHFPFPKQEAWWIILGTREGKIIDIQKIAKPEKEFTHEIKFLAPKAGVYNFDLHVLSNSYIGLDQKLSVDLTTLDASALPEYKVHPDDAELDDEPTLFEEMLNAHNVEEDSDDDSDDDDSDDDSDDDGDEGIKELSAAERKKIELQKQRQAAAGADDSDDDSSVEEVYAD